MNRIRLLALISIASIGATLAGSALVACGGDDSSPIVTSDAGGDVSHPGNDAGTGVETGGEPETGPKDSGADSQGDGSAATYSIGGTVTGLAGSGLVLQNNAGDNLTVNANGTFVFAGRIAKGATFGVTVLTQPTLPSQTCTVSGGSGTVGSSDVTSVTVNCSSSQYTVGGTVSGLNGTVVLQNNLGDDLPVTSNGTFAFSQTANSAQPYSVTVLTQPAGQTCTVTNGTGVVGGANVSNVLVTCVAKTYAVGGTLSGLPASTSIQLQNNGGDTLTVNSSGPFSFATKLASGAAYNVTISTQPTGTTCTVNGGSGVVGAGDVTSISVNCTAGSYTVGGTVSGLDGTVVLQNNGGDNATLSSNGTFAFATPLATAATYAVTVLTQPTGQTCTVTNGTGAVGTANVTNVAVTCTTTKYTVGGTITGLKGTVILQNNGGDNLNRGADGAFTFTTPVPYKGSYNVTVKTQPNGQVCRVTNGSGIMGTANVTDIVVTCEDKRSIGGTAAGLSGSSVVLQNNGGDNLTVAAAGTFKFAIPLAAGATYNVTVLTQPSNRTCTVTNGTGTVGGTDVTNIIVTCVP
jgi:hypothetical protein